MPSAILLCSKRKGTGGTERERTEQGMKLVHSSPTEEIGNNLPDVQGGIREQPLEMLATELSKGVSTIFYNSTGWARRSAQVTEIFSAQDEPS